MALLNFLRSSRNARKIFGRRELKITEKQLSGINLTQSEKNRLSRDIREKFDFIKEAARFSDEFELKKGAEIKFKIEEAKEAILESELFPKIKRIILFGSAVENKMTFKSDIDIAVEFYDIGSAQTTKFRAWVSGRVSDKVDIQVFNTLPSKIKEEIIKKGRILYEK